MMLLSTVCGAVTSSLLVCAVLLLLRTNPNACISPACIDDVLLSSCHDNGSQLKGVDPPKLQASLYCATQAGYYSMAAAYCDAVAHQL